MPRTSLSGRRYDSESDGKPLLEQSLTALTLLSEFASSTILTIAHRLRTVIDYDRVSGVEALLLRPLQVMISNTISLATQVMLLDQGRIAEFDTPAALLSNPQSKFYALCKATGKQEFAVLKKTAGV